MTSWRDLVTASLIGTERAVVPAVSLPGLPPGAEAAGGAGDSAAVLLDRAALATAARRAGRRPDHAEPLPECDRDPRPAVSPAAGARLERMLRGEYPGLLAEWLAAAGARGLRPPLQLLPALLDRACRAGLAGAGLAGAGLAGAGLAGAGLAGAGLQRLAAEAGGPRARWLAALNPDWDFVTATGRTGPDTWRLGDASQRRGYLTGLLVSDPDAGRELIAASWAGAPGRERLEFLAALGGQLRPGDEPALEAALGDPSQDVRARAADLLATLPGSALGRRMAGRALACVRTEPGARGPELIITPPADRDDSMRRDGIPPIPAAPGSARPDRRRLLLEIVARTPLSTWTAAAGLSPAQVAARPAGDWAPALFSGWARAAIAQRDHDWITALIRLAIAGPLRFPAAALPAVKELALVADPALGAPGALPEPGPDTPPAARAILAVLRFRWDMLEELGYAGGAGT
jgi:hypothetical protein